MSRQCELIPDDWTLIDKCYREQYENLYKAAVAILKSPHMAQDIVQDTFLHAANHIEEIKSSENSVGWLYKAMQYQIMHAIRTRNMLLKRHISLEEAYCIPDYNSDMGVCELDPQNADLQLIIRYYEYGFSLQEIADEWRISVPAVKMRIKRARERLQNTPEIKNLKNYYF